MRPFPGWSNHVDAPLLGAAGTPYTRLAPAGFDRDDPLGERLAGARRPSARAVSNALFSAAQAPAAAPSAAAAGAPPARPLSELAAALLALVVHDLSSEFPVDFLRMASAGADAGHNIEVPLGDAQWDSERRGARRMPFMRSPFVVAPAQSGAARGERARLPLNAASHFLDLETLYGRPRDLQRALHIARLPAALLAGAGGGTGAGAGDGDGSAALGAATAAGGEGECGTMRMSGSGASAMLPLSSLPTGMAGGTAAFGARADDAGKGEGKAAPRRQLFQAGDERANLHPTLVALHTLLAREHNRVHAALAAADASDAARGGSSAEVAAEGDAAALDAAPAAPPAPGAARCAQLFARSAAVVRGELQAIAWHELLPALLGRARAAALPPYRGFNASVDPSVSAEFAAAAGLAWHAMLGSEVRALTPALSPRAAKGHFAGRFPLRDAFFAPQRALGGGLDPLLRGAWAQRAQPVAPRYAEAVRNSFLGEPGGAGAGGASGAGAGGSGGGIGGGPGLDLAAIDIQRGRDFGLPSLAALRAALGLAPLPRDVGGFFAELVGGRGAAPSALGDRVGTLYGGAPAELDLLVALLAEPHLPGGAVGETAAAVIAEQLVRTRDGDRFWAGDEGGAGGAGLARDAAAAGLPLPLSRATLGQLIARNTGLAEAAEAEVLFARERPEGAK